MYQRSRNLTVPMLTIVLLLTVSLACIEPGISERSAATTADQRDLAHREDRSPTLEILSSSNYVDAGWFYIVGEVRNNTNKPMEYVKIAATLYDAGDKVVGTDFAYTMLDVIPPHDEAPFEIGTGEWQGATRYRLQVQGRQGSLPRQDLAVRSHSAYVDHGWLVVRGEVENEGARKAEFVKLVITFYDATGDVVGVDFAYTTLDVIPAGGTSPFECSTKHWSGFDHYKIQVQGR